MPAGRHAAPGPAPRAARHLAAVEATTERALGTQATLEGVRLVPPAATPAPAAAAAGVAAARGGATCHVMAATWAILTNLTTECCAFLDMAGTHDLGGWWWAPPLAPPPTGVTTGCGDLAALQRTEARHRAALHAATEPARRVLAALAAALAALHAHRVRHALLARAAPPPVSKETLLVAEYERVSVAKTWLAVAANVDRARGLVECVLAAPARDPVGVAAQRRQCGDWFRCLAEGLRLHHA